MRSKRGRSTEAAEMRNVAAPLAYEYPTGTDVPWQTVPSHV